MSYYPNSNLNVPLYPNLGNTCFLNAALEALYFLKVVQDTPYADENSSYGLLSKISQLFRCGLQNSGKIESSLREVIYFLQKEQKMKLGQEGDSDIILSYILKQITTENKKLEPFFLTNFTFTANGCTCENSKEESGEMESLIFNISPIEGCTSLERCLTTVSESCSKCGFTQEIQYEFSAFPKFLIVTLNKTAYNYGNAERLFKKTLEFDSPNEKSKKTMKKYQFLFQILYYSYSSNMSNEYSNVINGHVKSCSTNYSHATSQNYNGSYYSPSGHYTFSNESTVSTDAKILFYQLIENNEVLHSLGNQVSNSAEEFKDDSLNQRGGQLNLSPLLNDSQVFKELTERYTFSVFKMLKEFITGACKKTYVTDLGLKKDKDLVSMLDKPDYYNAKNIITILQKKNVKTEEKLFDYLLDLLKISTIKGYFEGKEKKSDVCKCKPYEVKSESPFSFFSMDQVLAEGSQDTIFCRQTFENCEKCCGEKYSLYKIKEFPKCLFLFFKNGSPALGTIRLRGEKMKNGFYDLFSGIDLEGETMSKENRKNTQNQFKILVYIWKETQQAQGAKKTVNR